MISALKKRAMLAIIEAGYNSQKGIVHENRFCLLELAGRCAAYWLRRRRKALNGIWRMTRSVMLRLRNARKPQIRAVLRIAGTPSMRAFAAAIIPSHQTRDGKRPVTAVRRFFFTLTPTINTAKIITQRLSITLEL